MNHKIFTKKFRDLSEYFTFQWQVDEKYLTYTKLVDRWYAATIDFSFFLPLYLLCKNPFERQLERLNLEPTSLRAYILPFLLAFVPWLLYFYLPTLLFGKTLGKKALGMEVIGKNHQRDPFNIFIRETIGKALSIATLGSGYFVALIHPKRKTFHDILSNTSVVSHLLDKGKGPRTPE